MPRPISALAALALLATPAPAAPAAPNPADPAPAIAAERAFAARAAEVGMAPSFLEYMTDDAFIFAPDKVSAKAFYAARPPGKAPKDGGTLLAWWPNFAGMARSGDLAFTTGPARINGGKPGIFYFTVWARQPDGGWKWIYDGGIDGDGSKAPGPDAAPLVLPAGDATPMAPAKAMQQVKGAEVALATRAATDAPAAYRPVLAVDARVQGLTPTPATTPAAVTIELAARARAIDFAGQGGGASAAGDVVWTWGDAKWTGGRAHYVRVWQRRAGKWRLVFDQLLEVPKA